MIPPTSQCLLSNVVIPSFPFLKYFNSIEATAISVNGCGYVRRANDIRAGSGSNKVGVVYCESLASDSGSLHVHPPFITQNAPKVLRIQLKKRGNGRLRKPTIATLDSGRKRLQIRG